VFINGLQNEMPLEIEGIAFKFIRK